MQEYVRLNKKEQKRFNLEVWVINIVYDSLDLYSLDLRQEASKRMEKIITKNEKIARRKRRLKKIELILLSIFLGSFNILMILIHLFHFIL